MKNHLSKVSFKRITSRLDGVMNIKQSNQLFKVAMRFRSSDLEKKSQLLKEMREDRIRKMTEKYTQEEFESLVQSVDKVHIMEISTENLNKVKLAKRLSLFFNIPLSFSLMYLCEFVLIGAKYKTLSTLLYICDYFFFLNAVMILSGLRNIVLASTYHTSTSQMEFTKMDLLNRPYTVSVDSKDLKRVPRSPFTPFLSLKHKSNGTGFSMNGLGVLKDHKLYNFLFPAPVQKKRGVKNKGEEFKLWDN